MTRRLRPHPATGLGPFAAGLIAAGLIAAGLIGATLPAEASPRHPARPHTASRAKARHPAAPPSLPYGRRDDVMRFAKDVSERRHLDPAWVAAALERARFTPSVVRFVMPAPAGSAKNWSTYRARFVEPVRIRAGVAFWRANVEWLARAEAVYGVPPEIVVGIIGVETIYGRQMGDFHVVDALATLAFDFPAGRTDRSAFFRDELESFLAQCAGDGVDPATPTGSFAGAMGMPQFMPSSVQRFAVDFDADGRIDLQRSPADVIGSVAHYLAEFGWQRGLPTRFDVVPPVDVQDLAVLLAPDILPTFTTQELAAHGARLDPAAVALESLTPPLDGKPMKLALVELQNGPADPVHVAGTANFYAITRYNWSSYYAMAVVELGEAVRRAVDAAAAR